MRMSNTLSRVASNITATAVGTTGRPGSSKAATALTPSADTGGNSRLLNTLIPSMINPAIGPSVSPTMTYSPPAAGHAEDSSA